MSRNNLSFSRMSNVDADIGLGDLAAKVVLQNFDYRLATLLLFNSSLYYGVETFLRAFNINVILSKDTLNPKLIKVIRQYVMFGSDISDLEQLIASLNEMRMINTGKFVIVCESKYKDDCNEAEITKLLWSYRMVNVALIKSEKAEAIGFTYFPISNGQCDNLKPIKLNLLKSGFHTDHGAIFEMKFKNLNLCPLYVSTFIQAPYMNITNGKPIGADGDLLHLIAYGLNTSIKMMTPHRGDGWGYRLTNGTWMGSLADLYEDFANISMTSAALTLTRFSDFQISRNYYTTYVVWITHPAMLQNEALKLLRPFEQSTRIALIVSYIIVILCAFIVKTRMWSALYHSTEDEQYSKSVVFYSWMICTGQALIRLPTKSFLLQMTYLWIYYCFIIRTVYQVYLISSLKGMFYEDQIETIEDAIKANYQFGGGPALRDYYIDHPLVYNNWVNIKTDDIVPTLMSISKGKKFVLAMSWDTAKLLVKMNKIKLHILPQKIVSSPTAIFFKFYSPLAESINVILDYLPASGFVEMLHKHYTTVNSLDDKDNQQETLKIIHFTACYVILFIGSILSAVFFLLEVYFGKIYKHPWMITS